MWRESERWCAWGEVVCCVGVLFEAHVRHDLGGFVVGEFVVVEVDHLECALVGVHAVEEYPVRD
jgi:hypothetical protein